jgi:hypothetical protein
MMKWISRFLVLMAALATVAAGIGEVRPTGLRLRDRDVPPTADRIDVVLDQGWLIVRSLGSVDRLRLESAGTLTQVNALVVDYELVEVGGLSEVLDDWSVRTYRNVVRSELRVRLWPVAALCIAMALSQYLFARKTKSMRIRRGQCVACGYDLRGTTDQRCPECGTPKKARS